MLGFGLSAFLENLDQGLRLQLQGMLSLEGVEPEVKVISNVKALSAFAYTGENQLAVHCRPSANRCFV